MVQRKSPLPRASSFLILKDSDRFELCRLLATFYLEVELIVLAQLHVHAATIGELAEQQLLGQWSLQAFLNDARHRTGTHFRVVATIGDPQARRFIDIQLHVISEERRVGNACVSKFRSRWLPYH